MYYIIANPNSGNKKGLDVLNEVTMHLNDLDKKYKFEGSLFFFENGKYIKQLMDLPQT